MTGQPGPLIAVLKLHAIAEEDAANAQHKPCANWDGSMPGLFALHVVMPCLQVAVKTAKGCHARNHNTHYSYDDFLQVEWEAYSRIQAAEPTVSTGIPAMLAAGAHCQA